MKRGLLQKPVGQKFDLTGIDGFGGQGYLYIFPESDLYYAISFSAKTIVAREANDEVFAIGRFNLLFALSGQFEKTSEAPLRIFMYPTRVTVDVEGFFNCNGSQSLIL